MVHYDRHPAYGDYNATQRGAKLFSPSLYEIMKGKNPNLFFNIRRSKDSLLYLQPKICYWRT